MSILTFITSSFITFTIAPPPHKNMGLKKPLCWSEWFSKETSLTALLIPLFFYLFQLCCSFLLFPSFFYLFDYIHLFSFSQNYLSFPSSIIFQYIAGMNICSLCGWKVLNILFSSMVPTLHSYTLRVLVSVSTTLSNL